MLQQLKNFYNSVWGGSTASGEYAILAEVAGDDFALNLMSFYFGSFDALRTAFSERARMLERRYVRPLRDDRTDAQRFWEEYRVAYERYLREADHG